MINYKIFPKIIL